MAKEYECIGEKPAYFTWTFGVSDPGNDATEIEEFLNIKHAEGYELVSLVPAGEYGTCVICVLRLSSADKN